MNGSYSPLPLAYLITFRCYGTWLHGDERSSVDRHRNRYESPRIANTGSWLRTNAGMLKHPPVTLDASRRRAVKGAVYEACDFRGWRLQALNVRTNHVHIVVSAACEPERVLTAFKAYATRRMRETGCWPHRYSPWAEGGSKRYLWTDSSVQAAIVYVLERQGAPLSDEL
jgi:REP element-mobilizing transposase RayT